MITKQQLDEWVTSNQLWNEPEVGGYNLNCSAPNDEPDRDPRAGEICRITVLGGRLCWRWQWNGSYDAHYGFNTLEQWIKFWDDLMDWGIGGVDAETHGYEVV